MDRYSRQTILAEIGPRGQEILSRARVLCVGAGGLGSPALMYLAAAGIGKLGVIDGDRVDSSNLQRQILFSDADVGGGKARLAGDRLRAQNPGIVVHAHESELTAENAADIFEGYDVILDGTDNFATKFLINDACVKLGLPLVYGSISQFEGQVSVFWPETGPCYRCLHPEPPKARIQNCAESGVIGAVAGTIGSLMAMEAIKVVFRRAGHDSRLKPLIGRLLVLDLATNDFMNIRVPRRPQCPVCSGPREAIVLQGRASGDACAPASAGVSELELRAALASAESTVLDVREEPEWRAGHLRGSRHFALSRLEGGERPDFLAPDQPVIVICKAGARSERAGQILRADGFRRVRHFKPGVLGWSGELEREVPR